MRLENDTYVDKAQKVIEKLKNDTSPEVSRYKDKLLSTSKIRNILSLTVDIYNDVITSQDEKLSRSILDRINYLKVKIVYEMGRNSGRNGDPRVSRFIKEADLLACIDEIRGSRQQYLLFSRYMEALVAYHRFYGGEA